MFYRLKQELKRLFCTKQTWLLVAILILGPILITTDFFGWGTRAYDTTISNVLMLNPARLSLYISAFSIMVFTLLQLRQLYDSSTYTILEATVDPLTQIVLQTIAIGIITILSVCVSLLVLYPYTALTMGTLFSFLKFLRTWVYVYLLGMLITLLLSSGIFLIFWNFEVSLILVSAMMLFSIGQSEESYYLIHWLQTAVTSIADGTESTLRFKIVLFTRFVGLLVGANVYAAGLLCVRRYSKGIAGSAIKNARHAVIPLLMVFSIIACGFYIENDPLYWKDKNDVTLLEEYVVNEETQTIVADESADSEYNERLHDYEEEYNTDVIWLEMDTELTIESDCLHGVTTYLIDNLSEEKEMQELAIRITRGIEIKQIFCEGESLDFSKGDFNFIDYYLYQFVLPAGLDNAMLEVVFEGTPKGSADDTELDYCITGQYVQVVDEYPHLMTLTCSMQYTINLPKNMTLIIPGHDVEEVTPAQEGYRSYTFTVLRGAEATTYVEHYIFAGDYVVETAYIGDMEIQFAYFRKKAEIMKEVGAMGIIEGAVMYFTDLYGQLEMGEKPLIIVETAIDFSSSRQEKNLCLINESAVVSSLYQAEKDFPDASRSAGLQSLVKVIAKQWWNHYGYGAFIQTDWEYNLTDAFTNYSTYLYLKHLYGEEYAQETLVAPWYKIAKYQQNEFYRCNKQYISILPVEDAIEIYYPYQCEEQEREYIVTSALFHVEELVGGEDVLVEKLEEIYNEFKGGYDAYLTTLKFFYNDLFFEMLGITQEEFEAW